ncbi:MAG TPA: hypothetical protein VH597_05180 [Verrucomicrobiae bacterium]|nr:hypothetical protein [Verrucomicrobiae bacterium]
MDTDLRYSYPAGMALRCPRRAQRRNVWRNLRGWLADSARYYAGGDATARHPYLSQFGHYALANNLTRPGDYCLITPA